MVGFSEPPSVQPRAVEAPQHVYEQWEPIPSLLSFACLLLTAHSAGRRVLDFGCGAKPALRHGLAEAEEGEFWGSEIRSPKSSPLAAARPTNRRGRSRHAQRR